MATKDEEEAGDVPTEGIEKVSIVEEETEDQSALRSNIQSKGKNAYYFAHANTPTGPKWDGKLNPKLLGSRALSSEEMEPQTTSAFEYHKSNITSYAFSDEGKNVKLYLSMDEIGEKCQPEDIDLQWTDRSFCLVVKNFKEQDQCLSFAKLTGKITNATYKQKKDRLIVVLKKEDEEKEWHTINDKGNPDHEIV